MLRKKLEKVLKAVLCHVAQGIAELGAHRCGRCARHKHKRVVTDAFEAINPDPRTSSGEITEDLVAFGVGFIPIAGWLGRAGQVAKLAKAGKPMSTAGRGKFTKSAIEFGTTKTGQKFIGTWSGLARIYSRRCSGYDSRG